MKNIKEFFSPLPGGHHKGLKFSKWIQKFDKIGVFSIFSLAIILLGIFEGPNTEWDYVWHFWAVEGGLFAVLCIFVFKTLQHWSDLRNNTSR